MKTDTPKDVTYYENLPYTVTIRKDDEGDFIARIIELPGCVAHGENESSAIESLRSVQRLWVEEALSAGNPIPEPEEISQMPSGKWVQRVPRRLHRELVNAAKLENVSLNQLVTSMLSEALAVRNCAKVFEVFLARMPQPIHQMRDAMWWSGDPEQRASDWTFSPHPRRGNIREKLAHIRKITSSEFNQHFKELEESQLARP